MSETKTGISNLVVHGINTCAGCGLELLVRNLLDVLGENTIVLTPPGCVALFTGIGNACGIRVAGFTGNLGSAAAVAAGVRRGYEMQGRNDIHVVALAGDGGTVDIGLQSLSGMFERGDRVLYVCYDNEAYMNTGIQGSGSTPAGARTTTTPAGKRTGRKDMVAIAAAHGVPYAASASVGYIHDLRAKIEKASRVDGPSYVHVHTPCPTGWASDPARTVEIARLAVQTSAWPLVEVESGRWSLRRAKPQPVRDYLALQGRFSHLTEAEIAEIQRQIEANLKRLEWLSAGQPQE
jgi:pyruvate/2-oxoacid:ferredoxin oxidoreductase beta subunit